LKWEWEGEREVGVGGEWMRSWRRREGGEGGRNVSSG